ncbi:unnamed protein product [Ceratitis capitata]|uniref:(Mediterranean fruit fly) hypothetical protein n=1 Tax=Ceratitis capitata TaxID=7213 RepID=A0A811VDC6_CERCA|nr:unnamed protein product [Ceratitis capitata]
MQRLIGSSMPMGSRSNSSSSGGSDKQQQPPRTCSRGNWTADVDSPHSQIGKHGMGNWQPVAGCLLTSLHPQLSGSTHIRQTRALV